MTILFLGKHPGTDWRPLEEQFSCSARQLDEVLSRVENLSRFATPSSQPRRTSGIAGESAALSTGVKQPCLSNEQARLPCVILPSTRTSRFFDRIDVIEKMEAHFNETGSEQVFQSLILHGLGGVGKSTVALRFAENKLRKGELDALFWIYSEKLVSIRKSFTDIALRLKLSDARQGDHDKNIAVVLNWLQHTRKMTVLL